MHITPLYAAILALLFMLLSSRVFILRNKLKIAIGDDNNPIVFRAIRVHANFAEYVPLGILLIFFVEQSGASYILIHTLNIMFLLARISHAFGVSQNNEKYKYRVFAMILTVTTIVVSSLYLLYSIANHV